MSLHLSIKLQSPADNWGRLFRGHACSLLYLTFQQIVYVHGVEAYPAARALGQQIRLGIDGSNTCVSAVRCGGPPPPTPYTDRLLS
ncbi:hypothetical protein Cni_G05657 [Canna indica]|uniref:Uncharacterized protein n=1 Tax=Canna indica TaxID=4628 RepID=A0AAQ3JV37_9LILI|nr:hypothetical protein Cni_G05657 [Canna indica]